MALSRIIHFIIIIFDEEKNASLDLQDNQNSFCFECKPQQHLREPIDIGVSFRKRKQESSIIVQNGQLFRILNYLLLHNQNKINMFINTKYI